MSDAERMKSLLRARSYLCSAKRELESMTAPPAAHSIPAYGQHALRDLLSGIREIHGRESHPRIAQALRLTTHPSESDETPWCSAIMCLWMHEAGLPHTRSAAARSWLEWGHERQGDMQPWDAVVLWRGHQESRSGHVGLGLAQGPDGVWMLGGNQGNEVSLRWYGAHRVLSVRHP